MVHLLKLLRFWLHQQVEQRHPHLLSVGLVVFSLLLAGMQFLPVSFLAQGALAAPTGQKPPMQKTTFTLDGVTVIVNTPFLPGKAFHTSQPGDVTQVATILEDQHPYRPGVSFLRTGSHVPDN